MKYIESAIDVMIKIRNKKADIRFIEESVESEMLKIEEIRGRITDLKKQLHVYQNEKDQLIFELEDIHD